jgi:hypothetical protein
MKAYAADLAHQGIEPAQAAELLEKASSSQLKQTDTTSKLEGTKNSTRYPKKSLPRNSDYYYVPGKPLEPEESAPGTWEVVEESIVFPSEEIISQLSSTDSKEVGVNRPASDTTVLKRKSSEEESFKIEEQVVKLSASELTIGQLDGQPAVLTKRRKIVGRQIRKK